MSEQEMLYLLLHIKWYTMDYSVYNIIARLSSRAPCRVVLPSFISPPASSLLFSFHPHLTIIQNEDPL